MQNQSKAMSQPLWQPTERYIEDSNLKKYENWLLKNKGLKFENYQQIWQWSVENLEDFWESLWQFFDVKSHSPYKTVLQSSNEMLESRWFVGATLNYAEHVFRNKTTDYPAIIFKSEVQPTVEISWDELENQVVAIQQYLIKKGIQKGDRIVGYLANTPETVAIFLAVNSLGAIWSCCSPDFGVDSIVDRFQQIEPKILFTCTGYHYGSKYFDKSQVVSDLSTKLISLDDVVVIGESKWNEIIAQPTASELIFTPVEFSHPIWVLYSSGTTGKPKAITHSTGGNLIEHLKALVIHQNVSTGERFSWYTTTGWMMWNYAISSLLCGATLCIYDGSPGYPNMNVLWEFVRQNRINHFGSGAAFYIGCMKNLEWDNEQAIELKKYLKTIGSTGSPLPPEAFKWIYEKVSANVQLISLSGGTDVCSAFIGGSPYLPVYEGEMQCFTLGSAIEAWNDEGKPVENEVGELIITQPMPSMPIFFWNDTDNQRYRSSYFEKYPKVWCHGDWIKTTENKGVVIYGRSDATLNRDGVRIGTAEIYNAVESLPFIKDSVVVCIEKSDGSSSMPLFVVLNNGESLDDEKIMAIKRILRTQYSPRHVPDAIFEVTDIPYTISGKKMEMPIKKILMRTPLEKAVSLDTMRNPDSIQWFVNYIEKNV